MTVTDVIAQGFGVLGFVLSALSFQERNNKKFFIKLGLSGFMFALNYILIGVVPAALFNVTNAFRGAILSKNDHKKWRLVVIEALYTACFIFSLIPLLGDNLQVILAGMTYSTLVVTTIFMWLGNGKHIRYVQFAFSSPVWLIHNVFNFTLGGILCEILSMTSVVISFIRFGKDGFEK